MTKAIEQSPVCECKPPMVNQDGICMICKKLYVADHIKQYLIRAGYLKAIEYLKSKEARSYEETRVKMGCQVASSGWGSFLESKIDEVLK